MDKSIAVTLGKLLVAVSWADGNPGDDEIQVLKDLIFQLPELNRDDQASIEVYLENPVDAKECQILMDKFKELISTDEEKRFALTALRRIIYADGQVTANEAQLYQVLADGIMNASSGLDAKLEGFFLGARKKRQRVLNKIPKRERNLEDFVDNPVFYRSFRSLADKGVVIHLDKAELEVLCTAGALMACIAQADGEVHPDEVSEIEGAMMRNWKISNQASTIVAEIAVNHEVIGMDILRLCRKFFGETEANDRQDFFHVLIDVVKADMVVHANELERLRQIATHLKIPTAIVLKEIPRLGPVDPADLRRAEDKTIGEEEEDPNAWMQGGDPEYQEEREPTEEAKHIARPMEAQPQKRSGFMDI